MMGPFSEAGDKGAPVSILEELPPPPSRPRNDWKSLGRPLVLALCLNVGAILLLIVGLHWSPRAPLGMPADRPIAVSLLAAPEDSPDADTQTAAASGVVSPEIEMAATAAKAQASAPATPPAADAATAQSQATPASSDSVVSDALPYDPSFNPFAGANTPPIETYASTPTAPPSAQISPDTSEPPAVPPAKPQPPTASGGGSAGGQINNVGAGPQSAPRSAASGLAAGAIPNGENPLGKLGNGSDPLMHPQFLQVQLGGYISAEFTSQLQSFLLRLISCGVHPIEVKNPDLSVEADVSFAPNGAVRSAILTNTATFGSDPDYRPASDRLMKALSNPGCTYFQLPPLTYPSWREVHVSFFQRN